MLFKEKNKEKLNDDVQNFNFFKMNDKKPKKKTVIKLLKNTMLGIVGLQFVFAGYNVFRIRNHLSEKITIQSELFSKSFPQLQQGLKTGDQHMIINNFSKIKNNNTAVSDLIAGGIILNNMYSEINDDIEYKKTQEYKDYGSKFTTDTQNLMTYMYKNNLNSGVIKDRNELNNIQCFLIDITCYIGRPILQNKIKEVADVIDKKVEKNNYNINHSEEYKLWVKNLIKKQKDNNVKPEDYKSPGDKYMEGLN